MSKAAPRNGQINIETYGNGARHVVALHCSLGRAASWAAIAKLMPKDITLIAPDWPGHGKSASWVGKGLMRETAVSITRDVVGQGPVDLVGHSYGAIIALDFATRFPDRVRSLTVIEPIFLAIAGQDNRSVLDSYLADMQPHFDALANGDNEEAARQFIGIWGGGAEWEKMPESARAALTQQIPVVDACKPGDENSAEERRMLDGLENLTMPVKIIYGDQTLPIIKLVMQGLKTRVPHAELVKITGAGHMIPLTHAQDIAAELLSFW